MHFHQDFATDGFRQEPVAQDTGPFPRRPLLEAWWRHRAGDTDRLLLVEDDEALLPWRSAAGTICFLGEEDLVDYHSPLGEGVSGLVSKFFAGLPPGTPFRFDSLPAAAASVIAAGLDAAGVGYESRIHEVSAVLALPGNPDDYLHRLGRKQRHEVRRKRRRFTEQLGEPRLVPAGEDGFEDFVRLHRQAAGAKGGFLDDAMAAFFAALLRIDGSRIDLLYGDGPDPVAAVFGFETDGGYYLYNSGYEPAVAAASPGIVLLHLLVIAAIETGLARFDFLKGDEAYKFRLGADRRDLYVIEGVR